MKLLRERSEQFRLNAEAKDRYIASERKKLSNNIDLILTPTIKEFFRGAGVFITGGTGFVGKVLTEKLLRSCPDIERIYFLVRKKRGKEAEQRLEDLFKSQLFEKLMREKPDAVKKVIPIIGDVAEIGLGLSEDDRMLLQHNTKVVFHAAATVRFDEPFAKAVLLNCRGTREIVELCKSMLKLKAMVHVSTTYCNTDRAISEEEVYSVPLHWSHVIKIAESDDPNNIECLHKMLLGRLPNTYTFTKRIAENIVNDARHEIPVIIGRPSVVISTVSDPVEGWWDNFMGPPGLYIGITTGIVRILYADPQSELDYFAVDYVIRELILIAWIRGTGLKISSDPDKIDVINMSVRDCYEAKFQESLVWDQEANTLHPPLGIRFPRLTLTQNKFYFMYRVIMSHILFGIIVDTILRLVGQKPRLLKIYRRVQVVNNAVEFFLCNAYKSTAQNYFKSITFTKEEDFDDFGQIIAFSFYDYTLNARLGVYKYLLKKEPDFEWNHKVQILLKVVHWTWQALKLYILYRLLLWILF